MQNPTKQITLIAIEQVLKPKKKLLSNISDPCNQYSIQQRHVNLEMNT